MRKVLLRTAFSDGDTKRLELRDFTKIMQAPVTEHRVKPKSALTLESLLSATAEGYGFKD